MLLTITKANQCAACKQEYEERSARIRKLREQVGGETDTLNALTAALEAKKVQCTSSPSRLHKTIQIMRCAYIIAHGSTRWAPRCTLCMLLSLERHQGAAAGHLVR